MRAFVVELCRRRRPRHGHRPRAGTRTGDRPVERGIGQLAARIGPPPTRPDRGRAGLTGRRLDARARRRRPDARPPEDPLAGGSAAELVRPLEERRGSRGPGRCCGRPPTSRRRRRGSSRRSGASGRGSSRSASAAAATIASSRKVGSVAANRRARSLGPDRRSGASTRRWLRAPSSAAGPSRAPRRGPASSRRREVVQGGHRVARPDRAGVDPRIAELAVGDGPVLVADEPVRRDHGGIELDLDLGVEGDGLERPDEVLDEQPAGLGEVVDVGVEAVALVGQLLEQDVVVVAHPDADRDQLDAGRGVVADPAEDAVGVGQPDVGDAVRGEDRPGRCRRRRAASRAPAGSRA